MLVPAERVARVVEVELSPPPPLAREWIGGLGHSENEVFVAVDLGTGKGAGLATCVVLDSERPRPLLWALRVDRSIGFASGTPCPRDKELPAEWPAWIGGARLSGSSDIIGLLDVTAMTMDFDR